MQDPGCVEFLHWALPRLHLSWPGFRKVHRQVCKRLSRRLRELGLAGLSDYSRYLERHTDEWGSLELLCSITISRFYRDRPVFEALALEILPALARAAIARHTTRLCGWSIGCASGEEAYTIVMLWAACLAPHFPDLRLYITATDIREEQLERAIAARYPTSSLKELPSDLKDRGFSLANGIYTLREELRRHVVFVKQDIRDEAPEGVFDLILCRNLVFTYFDETLQRVTLARILDHLAPAGALVIGRGEGLPGSSTGLAPWYPSLRIYQENRSGPNAV